ncbi:MAG: extracellular solute-binding protein [Caldilineaceae bacterium]
MTKRLLVACCILVGLLLAACDNDAPPTATPVPEVVIDASASATPAAEAPDGAQNVPATPTATATPIGTPTPPPIAGTVTLWHSWAGADGDALNAMLDTAAQRYPELTVQTLFVAYDDLVQAYVSAVQNGGGPDLFLAPNQWLGDLVDAQAVLALDEAQLGAELDAFWPAARDSMRWRGTLYGLPTNFELVSLFYNRGYIEPGALPGTTDDMLALVQNNSLLGVGLYNSLYHLYWGIPAYGGQLFDENGMAVLDQSPGTADYLNWLAAMNGAPGNFVDSDYAMLLDRFKKGEFAFFVDGPWSIDDLRGALGDNLGVAQLPAGPAGPGKPWLSADGIFLNPASTADQQRLARALALHLSSAESGAALAQIAHRLPANNAVIIADDPLLAGFMQQAVFAEPMPLIPEMNEAWGYGGDMLIKALNGVAEADEIVRETTTLINEANGK